ncbi:DUF6134 family protein [Magnetospirillum sulfuroxidans]|uniref:Secreted protein n=1 Tax=Magnetospirillum sulfuroxidans TaxID=611300 RepID=A0ABS5I827_9PROT|nr:DUF6134 family protein [Magnetospirillum sulfuroxidans]MBR9970567.1 hypothetical protein [Magnetospirillum sulfuroxidans]
MRITTIFVSAATLCLAVSSAFAATEATVPSHDPLSFTVLRNGDAVGSHILRFQSMSDGTLVVTTDTNVVVKMAMIPVYRFEHHGREIWHGDHLMALNSETNDDGTHHVLKASGATGALIADGDGKIARLPAETVPASLWNNATVVQGTLLNTLDGHAMAVHIADLGEDTVTVSGHPHPARHYAMTGDLNREVWYDSTGGLVQVRFKAKDDSDIQYVLK